MIEKDGWIKLYRKIADSNGYFSEAFCRNMAWIDLLLLANHDDNFFRIRGVRVDVKRGHVGYTEQTLAKRWKWSRGKVRRFLKELENEKQIVQQKTNVTTLISIVKYDDYQDSGTAKRTTDRHQTGQQTDINKNVKNVKNEKKIHSALPEPELPFKSEEFGFAWNEWVLDRKERNKKITPRAMVRQFNFLKTKTEQQAIEIINHAIQQGWQGLYEIRSQKTKRLNAGKLQ